MLREPIPPAGPGARRDLCCGKHEAFLEQHRRLLPKAASRNQPLCRGCAETHLQLSPGSAAVLPQGQQPAEIQEQSLLFPVDSPGAAPSPQPGIRPRCQPGPCSLLGAKTLLSPPRGSRGLWGQQLPALARQMGAVASQQRAEDKFEKIWSPFVETFD